MSAGRGRSTELSAAAVPDLEATGTNSSVGSRRSQKRWSNTRYTGLKDEELPKINDKMWRALTAAAAAVRFEYAATQRSQKEGKNLLQTATF